MAQFMDKGSSVLNQPPKLVLELRQIEVSNAKKVKIAVSFVNRGGGVVRIDPVMFPADLTLITFTDPKTKKKVIPSEGGELYYFQLHPDKFISLASGYIFGLEKEFTLPRTAAGLDVVAVSGYPEKQAKGLVWFGQIRSNVIRIDSQVTRPIRRRQ